MSGVIKGIGKAVKGGVGGFLSGGPLGAIVGGIGGLLSRPKEDPRFQAQQGYLNQLNPMLMQPPQTAGVNPLSTEAFGLFRNLATQGPNISQFYNPYEGQVLQGMERDIGSARSAALRTADDIATKSGAFGGSRAGAFAARALGDVNKAGLSQMGLFRHQGFQNALQAAQGQQMFGLQAANSLMGAGDYARSIEQAGYDAPFNRLAALGPLYASQLYSGQGYQQRPSALQSALGGALTGFGLFKKGPQTPSAPAPMQPWMMPPKTTIKQTFGGYP